MHSDGVRALTAEVSLKGAETDAKPRVAGQTVVTAAPGPAPPAPDVCSTPPWSEPRVTHLPASHDNSQGLTLFLRGLRFIP